ncbi:ester cyclase [Jannaschia sp. Os4]|uniref:nuclear transport factor 2 family protein n=1 Tax=Jannaschia sp. Os4 TaxID=2807617 RepID=UPI00193A7AB7|nr:ester cyclase [Jannaschia sp. Os4]MBM2576907.1 ester cyclase [Jannaschia sp. Os4]
MTDPRAATRLGLDALLRDPSTAEGMLTADAVWDVSAPVDRVEGRDAIVAHVVEPLRAALSGLHRRDLIVMGGPNRRTPETHPGLGLGGDWVACVTHYVGNHVGDLWGVAPSGSLAFLRAGEFHMLDDTGRIVLSRIILDLPDLMLQAGRDPYGVRLGTEVTFPAPATQDGLCPPSDGGDASLAVVERMLGDLHVYDPETGASAGQTGADGTWADGMMWYGPAGVGSNYTWDGFAKDHRMPFLHAFPDRQGGNHFCRLGDGPYAAISGWPSMTMTHRGAYLGVPATDKALTLRVMDFYRVGGGRIAENWVLLDYVDLMRQMGRDVLA